MEQPAQADIKNEKIILNQSESKIDLKMIHEREMERHRRLKEAGLLEQIPGKDMYHLRIIPGTPDSVIEEVLKGL